MSSKRPLVSIVMPVHNYDMYIKEAVDSVLNQTMTDFEFIIINDGSSDDSGKIAHSYNDSRIRIIDFSENRGCYPARNYGMRLAQGKYICVMDADDICLPKRLEVQSDFLEKNLSIGLIGSAYRYMNDYRPIYRNTNSEIIRLLLLKFCYLLHPTCMIRHSLVKKYNLYYDENLMYASDYAWQVKASQLFMVSNVNEILLLYREHEHQISNRESQKQGIFANQVRIQQLTSLGLEIKNEEIDIILSFLMTKNVNNSKKDLDVVKKFIEDFIAINKMRGYYSKERLATILNLLFDEYKIIVLNKS